MRMLIIDYRAIYLLTFLALALPAKASGSLDTGGEQEPPEVMFDYELNPKIFEASKDNDSGVGLSYLIETNDAYLREQTGITWLDIKFKAEGNIATDSDRNPEDFLNAKLGLGYWDDITGGLNRECIPGTPSCKPPTTPEAADKQGKPNIFTYRYRLTSSYEANQEFTTTQFLYGSELDLSFRSYGSTLLSNLSLPAQATLLLRRILGDNRGLTGAWPDLAIELDRVHPIDNDPRVAAGDKSDYTRLSFDIAFQDPIGEIQGRDLWIELRYRNFRELSPSQQIQTAELDSFEYFEAKLIGFDKIDENGTKSGPFVSFSSGKLPFDLKSQNTVSIGWNFSWGADKKKAATAQ